MSVENKLSSRRKKPDLSPLLYGKMPPQASELESAILGAMMLEPSCIMKVLQTIKSEESFYSDANQRVYAAIKRAHESGKAIDFLVIIEELRKSNELEMVGGSYYVTSLTRDVVSSANIETHCRLVLEKHIAREIIRIGGEFIGESYEDASDVFETLNSLRDAIQTLHYNIELTANKTLHQIITGFMDDTNNEISKKKAGDFGVKTYIPEYDKVVGNLQGGNVYVWAARTSMGKCLGKGTKVVMHDGSLKNVEDVKSGDKLMGVDSTPRNVISTTSGKEMMYWVRQKRGIDYRVNESHILSLKMSGNGYGLKTGCVVNIGVTDFLNKSEKFKRNAKGYKVDIDMSEKEVLIPPYILGIWLGDGKTLDSQIFNIDKEVHDELNKYSLENGNRLSHTFPKDRCEYLRICGTEKESSFASKLKSIGVIGNKHIPDEYIYTSKKNRLEILAGLLDSDGYYTSEFNCFEITQKSFELSTQIKYICDSLGFRTSIVKKKGVIKSIGFEGYYYRVRISGNLEVIPTKVERKKARKYKSIRNWKVTGIKLEQDRIDDYYGFEIDGDRLFLLEDMTVTHNTAAEISVALEQSNHIPVGVWNGELTEKRFVRRCISNLRNITVQDLQENPEMHMDEILKGIEDLMQHKLFMSNKRGMTIEELCNLIKFWVFKHGVKVVYLDYIQVIQLSEKLMIRFRTKTEQIGYVIDCLNEVSAICDIPIILLAQLNREATKGDKKPNLSHLRDSGSIEERVYHVMFIHRPEYYGEEEYEGRSTKGMMQWIIAKNGDGENNVTLELSHDIKFNKIYSRQGSLPSYEIPSLDMPF